jgi:hypothetical protein
MINDFQQKDTHYSKQLKAHYGPYLGTFQLGHTNEHNMR